MSWLERKAANLFAFLNRDNTFTGENTFSDDIVLANSKGMLGDSNPSGFPVSMIKTNAVNQILVGDFTDQFQTLGYFQYLSATESVLVNHDHAFQSETSNGTIKDIAKIDSNDDIILGNTSGTDDTMIKATDQLRFYTGGDTNRWTIGGAGAYALMPEGPYNLGSTSLRVLTGYFTGIDLDSLGWTDFDSSIAGGGGFSITGTTREFFKYATIGKLYLCHFRYTYTAFATGGSAAYYVTISLPASRYETGGDYGFVTGSIRGTFATNDVMDIVAYSSSSSVFRVYANQLMKTTSSAGEFTGNFIYMRS